MITNKLLELDDPEFCALYREIDAAFDWHQTIRVYRHLLRVPSGGSPPHP